MKSLDEILQLIEKSKLSLVLASTHGCSVCDVVEPKVLKIIKRFSEIKYIHIYIDDIVEASGEFMVFTVPTLILFAEGKEIARQGRFINFEELEFEINRWYEFLFK
ncbi:thioredoxin family protein [Clostridium tunisiense]|uniref:thioredoxin family protein n=1 Tax=Clostridium tunisiense TaxID=219748 RepID=UPI0002F2C844|nr:thioredoxin family protein [Clostridium tunisiense]